MCVDSNPSVFDCKLSLQRLELPISIRLNASGGGPTTPQQDVAYTKKRSSIQYIYRTETEGQRFVSRSIIFKRFKDTCAELR